MRVFLMGLLFLMGLFELGQAEPQAFNQWLPEKRLVLSQKPDFGRRLEPKGRRVVHGIGQSDRAFVEYWEQIGDLKPAMYMAYTPARERNKFWKRLKERLQKGDTTLIPQVGVPFRLNKEYLGSEEHKADLVDFTQHLKQWGGPVFLRPGYEFNGEWNDYEPEAYKKAWIALAKAIRGAKLDSVALVWCYAVEGMHTDYMRWYPGDEHVDWWGIDLFSPEHLAAGNTRKFLKDAAERRFPVMIGETSPRWVGAVQGEVSWEAWFHQFFRLLGQYPHIKAFSYITYNWAEYYEPGSSLHHWGDARVWRDSLVMSRWKGTLSNPVFIHAAESLNLDIRK